MRSGVKVDLQVVASSRAQVLDSASLCPRPQPEGSTCTDETLPDGTVRTVLRVNPGNNAAVRRDASDGSLLAVGIVRHDQFVVALATMPHSDRSPLGVDELQAIAGDPAVGIWTTPAFNAKVRISPTLSTT